MYHVHIIDKDENSKDPRMCVIDNNSLQSTLQILVEPVLKSFVLRLGFVKFSFPFLHT